MMRKWVPLTEKQLAAVNALRDSNTVEYAIAVELFDLDDSPTEADGIRVLIELGRRRLMEEVLDRGYQMMAEERTAKDREITLALRERRIKRDKSDER